MTNLDKLVEELTAKGSSGIPGVVLAASDRSGKSIYFKSSGFTSLAVDSPPISSTSVFRFASCTKLLTTIAALQCVERGLITLDEPIDAHLPELAKHHIISFNDGPDRETEAFKFTAPKNKITLRMLATHTSGVGYDVVDPRLVAWRKSRGKASIAVNDKPVTKSFDVPLIYEPGEGWMYGAGLDWEGLLVSRLNGTSLEEYIGENIFRPLGMTSSTFFLQKHPDIRDRLVETATRTWDGKLVPMPAENRNEPEAEQGGGELYASVLDFLAVLVDLLQESPKLLRKETAELLFTPQVTEGSPAMQGLKAASYIYESIHGDLVKGLKVNHSFGGLLVQEDAPTLGKTTGTASWAGATGTLWFANRRKGVAAVYASQLSPPMDSKTAKLMNAFMKHIWQQVE